eukprot:2628913-Pleurochrysis_carterae.AAC.1
MQTGIAVGYQHSYRYGTSRLTAVTGPRFPSNNRRHTLQQRTARHTATEPHTATGHRASQSHDHA